MGILCSIAAMPNICIDHIKLNGGDKVYGISGVKLNGFMHPIKQCGQEVILASETLTKREEGGAKREGEGKRGGKERGQPYQ